MRMEVRGRNREWSVWYPDESDTAHSVPQYDRDGILTGTIEAAAPTGKMVQAHFTGTRDEAEAFARWLGATEVEFVRIQKRNRKGKDDAS